MYTIKQLKELKSVNVTKTILHGKTKEDIPEIIEYCDDIVKNNKGAKYEIIGDKIEFNNGQFILLPKLPKQENGTLNFRSKDYTFTRPNGEKLYGVELTKKNIKLTDTGFIVYAPKITIEYKIIK